MKCKKINYQITIENCEQFDGLYKTSNSIYSNSYSYYRSPEQTDKYNTHFTVHPTGYGNDEFEKFHISLNFSQKGIRNGKIFYKKGVYSGVDDKNLTANEKVEFEKIFKDNKDKFDEIAIQFWKKVQEADFKNSRLENDTNEHTHRKHIQQIKKKVEDELLNRDGVTAIDIDYKVKKGVKTNELAIIVFVEKKYDISPELQIPKKIEGVKTDVWEGTFSPYSMPTKEVDKTSKTILNEVMANPIIGGVSVGPFDLNSYGTLGVVLDTSFGMKMMISSAHVLASGPHTAPGNPISQPALPFGGHFPETQSGSFYMGFIGQPNNIDAALATIPCRNAVSKNILGLGNTRGHDVTFPGDDVAKFGVTTQFTSGKVASDTFTVTINYPNLGQHTYYNQLRIQANNPIYAFAQPGDSGAMVVNEDMEVVGMVMGGGQANNGNLYAIANPIDNIIRTFEANGVSFI